MSLYRNILGRAWEISRRNKYLWFFGLFAALLGNGGEYEILVRGLSGETGGAVLPAWQSIAGTGIFSPDVFSNISNLMKTDPVSLLMLGFIGLVILALAAFLIWLSVSCQAALVNNAAGYLSGKKGDWQSGITAGKNNFLPVFGLNILNKLIVLIAFVLVGLPIILTAARSGSILVNLLYIILFVVFMAVTLSVSFIIKYAIAYVVIKRNKIAESVKLGWQLFAKNWLVSIEMAFILFFINFLAGLATILAVFIMAIPFLFSAVLFYKLAAAAGFWIVVTLAFILMLALVVLVGAVLAVFQISSWTALFVELISHGGVSKIVRVVNEWVDKK